MPMLPRLVNTILKESELETFPKNINTKRFVEPCKQADNIAQRYLIDFVNKSIRCQVLLTH